MFNTMTRNARQLARDVGREAHDLLERGLDRQLRLAVTGLSGAGKTAFLVSLIEQLRHAGLGARLELLPAARDGRLLGAERVSQPDLSIPRFPLEAGLRSLSGQHSPHGSEWPTPTRSISELRLKIGFRPTSRAARMLDSQRATLTLDLIDYPGEWLLDLPMLEQDFSGWSSECETQLADGRGDWAQDWMAAIEGLTPDSEVDEDRLAEIASLYTDYLHAARRKGGFVDLTPGRFLLPGELDEAPVLQFFPLPGLGDWAPDALAALPEASLYRTLARRFDHYRRRVVRPFYHDHFRRFDRQIVLIDVLGALNAGPAPFRDLSRALDKLFDSFAYGRRHLLARLMDRRIDRLAIAATKADHVTPEQHGAMRDLLEQLLADPLKRLRYRDVPLKAFTIAAIRASEAREVVENGQRHPALAGQLLGEHEGASDSDTQGAGRESVLLFPGEVPSRLPDPNFWAESRFDFPHFAPPKIDGNAPPHIRMDAVLDWLLGDHLK